MISRMGKSVWKSLQKKMTELQKEMSKSLPQSSVTVNAGNESRIVGTVNPTDPAPFDTKENRWWENF